jgi:hypothetical protein
MLVSKHTSMRNLSTTILTGAMACAALLSTPSITGARLPPPQEPDNAVFTATEVLVVSHAKEDTYMVEESWLGSLQVKDSVTLPGFKLVTFGKMGNEQPVEMNEQTRILLFLRPDEKDPKRLAITDYGYAFFFRDAKQLGELQTMAKDAIALRRRWEKAVSIAEPADRLEALWPYLTGSSRACATLTIEHLAKLNPLPGDYLAERMATYPASERGGWMLLCRQFPSDKLHAAAIADVKSARRAFETYLAAQGLERLATMDHWNDDTLPASIKDLNGEIYYGLAGIRSFKDPRDLPLFRELTPWLMRNQLDGAVEECVSMMKNFPAAENLAVLKSIWEDYQARHVHDLDRHLLPIDLARALAASKSIDAVPILKEIQATPTFHDEALNAIEAIENGP